MPEPIEYTLQERLALLGEVIENPTSDSKKVKALVNSLHSADLADYILRLSPDSRSIVWHEVNPANIVELVVELPEVIATDLVNICENDKLVAALGYEASIDDLATLLRMVSPTRQALLIRRADLGKIAELRKSLSYEEESVGGFMDFEHIIVQQDHTLGQVRELLQTFSDLPKHVDKLFVVDNHGLFSGILLLKQILLGKPGSQVQAIMIKKHLHTLKPEMNIETAAKIFEKYDLVSAPVLDDQGTVCGRLTIDEIVEHMSEEKHTDLLSSVGVHDNDELYSPLLRRLANRGVWMGLNLIAALFISRVVGAFEATISELVALAALMPIIANLAGNYGMQTATVVIRSLTLKQLNKSNMFELLKRELSLGLVNGTLWGMLVGFFAYLFYGNLALSMVLTFSQLIVFILSATVGYCFPILVYRWRGDPALGTAVVVTVVTDSMGFFTFLGLATILLT